MCTKVKSLIFSLFFFSLFSQGAQAAIFVLGMRGVSQVVINRIITATGATQIPLGDEVTNPLAHVAGMTQLGDLIIVVVQRPSGGRWHPDYPNERAPAVPLNRVFGLVQLLDDGGRSEDIEFRSLGYSSQSISHGDHRLTANLIVSNRNVLFRYNTADAESALLLGISSKMQSLFFNKYIGGNMLRYQGSLQECSSEKI
jgi:hypothetical protein